ncbi:MAG TPA: helix-turn-helix transcriptional regulator [Blastococcus sp.]|nr:helix-turn-helix transcriptional regulator [Blastococcus sp.]
MPTDGGLGRAIQVRRAELGLKRKDLARSAALSYPYLSELENGSKAPSAKALAQLAVALQLSPADLLARAEAIAPGVPEGEMRFASAADAYRAGPGRHAQAEVMDLPADSAILERIADLVATTVRAELNAWARNNLPSLAREELSRLLAPTEGDRP